MFHSPEITEKYFQISDLLDNIKRKTMVVPHSRETEAYDCWSGIQDRLFTLDVIEKSGEGQITISYNFVPPLQSFSETITKDMVEKEIGDMLEEMYSTRDFYEAMEKEYSIDPRKEKNKNKGIDPR